MRKELQKINKKRLPFTGTFVRYGYKSAYKGPPLKTVLLADITDPATGAVLCDHLWFNHTQGFADLGELCAGDVVHFEARVKTYRKGYRGRREDILLENPPTTDYKLSHPTKIRRAGSPLDHQVPQEQLCLILP